MKRILFVLTFFISFLAQAQYLNQPAKWKFLYMQEYNFKHGFLNDSSFVYKLYPDSLFALAEKYSDTAAMLSPYLRSSTAGTTYQAKLNGTGFVKATGTTISYDNSTYLTTSSAASTYLPLAGGTMSGAILEGTANTHDFGTSGTPFRTGYFGTSLVAPFATHTTSVTSPLIIGGTSTTSTLTLQTTSGVGTTGADLIFKGGNNGATEFMRILNSGRIGVGIAAPLWPWHLVKTVGISSGDRAVLWDITSSGTANYQVGLVSNLQAGYTGSGLAECFSLNNYTASTGTGIFNTIGGAFTGNIGWDGACRGVTNGDNCGIYGSAFDGLRNIGMMGDASYSQKNSASGLSVGIYGVALRANASAVHIGGLFYLGSSAPTLTLSAALIADNGSQTADIFVARDNGTAAFTIADGGAVTLTNTIKLKGYTVATLPAGVVGMHCYVTDALAPAYHVAVAGLGAVVTPVFYDGTNWIVD